MAARRWKWEDVPEINAAHIRSLDVLDRKLLRVFSAILEQNNGVDTPFENFVYELITTYIHSPITPQVLEDLVDRHRQHFDWMVDYVERFMNDFPEEFEAIRRKQVEASKRRERSDALPPAEPRPSTPAGAATLTGPPARRTGPRMEAH